MANENEKRVRTKVIFKHELEVDWLKSTYVPQQGELVVYDIEVDAEGNTLTRDGVPCLPSNRSTPYTQQRQKLGDGIHNINELPFTDASFVGGREDNALIQLSDVPNQAFGQNSSAFGFATIAGSKCFSLAGIDAANNTYILDFDPETEEGIAFAQALTEVIGEDYSVHIAYTTAADVFESRQRERYGKITTVDGNRVTVDVFYGIPAGATFYEETDYFDEDGVDTEINSFRITTHPTIGNRIIGIGATTKGWHTMATGKGGYAEGIGSIAHGSYGHAENRYTKAGYAAHAEGESTEANGLKSHAQNWRTKALGEGSDSFGKDTVAVTTGSSAGGLETIAGMTWIPVNSYINEPGGEYSIEIRSNDVYEEVNGDTYRQYYAAIDRPAPEAIEIQVTRTWTHRWTGLTAEYNYEVVIPKGNTASNYFDAMSDNYGNVQFPDGNYYDRPELDLSDVYTPTAITAPTELSITLATTDGLEVGDKYSLLNTSKLSVQADIGTITAIAGNTIEVSTLPADMDSSANYQLGIFSKPTLGSYITGKYASTAGHQTRAFGEYSSAKGQKSIALGINSNATGLETTASGKNSTTMGDKTVASGLDATATGLLTTASGDFALSQGEKTQAIGKRGVATGLQTIAYGNHSTAEGNKGVAFGASSHVQGSGHASDAYEGEFTSSAIAKAWTENKVIAATGASSFATGVRTLAAGEGSTTFGNHTRANGKNSIAAGQETLANRNNQTVIGEYNANNNNALFIVGNGDSNNSRSNAFTVDKNGNANISGDLNVNKINGFTLSASVPADAKFTDTTYNEATNATAGLMSAKDKEYLDGIKDNLNVSGAVTATTLTANNSFNTGTQNAIIGQWAGALGKKNSSGMQWVKVINTSQESVEPMVSFSEDSWTEEEQDTIIGYHKTNITFTPTLPNNTEVVVRISYMCDYDDWDQDYTIIGDGVTDTFECITSDDNQGRLYPTITNIELLNSPQIISYILEVENTEGFAKDQVFSIYQESYQKAYYNCGTILSVDDKAIIVDTMPTFTDMNNSNKNIYIGITTKSNLNNPSAKVYGNTSLTVGENNVAGASNTLAAGANNVVLGTASTAFGAGNKVLARNSAALGSGNEVNEGFGIAAGEKNFINHKWANALGRENRTGANYQTIVGCYNTETNGLFVVGAGTSDKDRKNAFIVNQDGTAILGDDYVATKKDVNDAISNIDTSADWAEISNKPNIEKGARSTSIVTAGTSTTSMPNIANGDFARAGGRGTKSLGKSSTTEGINTIAAGNNAFATGDKGLAVGSNAFVTGSGVQYTKDIDTTVSTWTSDLIAEVKKDWTDGTYYHAALGAGTTVLGRSCLAVGGYSIAAGERARTNGSRSFAFGYNVTAEGNEQTVLGKFNETNKDSLLIVGNGTSANDPKNALMVNSNGTVTIGADPINKLDVATKQYVDSKSFDADLSAYVTRDELPSLLPEIPEIPDLTDYVTRTELDEINLTLGDVKESLRQIINLQNALLGVSINGDEVTY